MIVETSVATVRTRLMKLDKDYWTLFTSKQGNYASSAREPIVLRPIWKENAFRIYGKTHGKYLYVPNASGEYGRLVLWATNPPGPGDTWATFRFTKTTGAS